MGFINAFYMYVLIVGMNILGDKGLLLRELSLWEINSSKINLTLASGA